MFLFNDPSVNMMSKSNPNKQKGFILGPCNCGRCYGKASGVQMWVNCSWGLRLLFIMEAKAVSVGKITCKLTSVTYPCSGVRAAGPWPSSRGRTSKALGGLPPSSPSHLLWWPGTGTWNSHHEKCKMYSLGNTKSTYWTMYRLIMFWCVQMVRRGQECGIIGHTQTKKTGTYQREMKSHPLRN